MKRFVSCLMVGSLVLTLPACGTLVGGSRQGIAVESDPAGAMVTSNPVTMEYTTPATIRLERKQVYTLTLSKDGYSKEDVVIEKQMRTGVLIADILLFPIGIIVDAITGAWYGLTPDPISVTLTKTSAELEGPDSISVALSTATDGDAVLVDSPTPITVQVEPAR